MTKEYQHNHYLKNRDKVLKKHKEYNRKVSLGLIIPKHKPVKPKCYFCKDQILGNPKIITLLGKEVKLDNGCFQWWREGKVGLIGG